MKQTHNFSLENLSFRFSKTSSLFFNNLNLTCQSNKLYFLQGHNGCGKSTLLRLLQGDVQPQEVLTGNARLSDHSVNLATTRGRTMLANIVKLVPQNVSLSLADNLTATQNLQLARLSNYPTLAALPQRIKHKELVQRCNIPFDKPVGQLSGGQRQLLAIIMALQKPTRLLLLDEPTAALDPRNTMLVTGLTQRSQIVD